MELLVCLVYSEESELGFLGDAFEGYLVQVCDAVEYVWTCMTGYEQIYQLLGTMSMMTD